MSLGDRRGGWNPLLRPHGHCGASSTLGRGASTRTRTWDPRPRGRCSIQLSYGGGSLRLAVPRPECLLRTRLGPAAVRACGRHRHRPAGSPGGGRKVRPVWCADTAPCGPRLPSDPEHPLAGVDSVDCPAVAGGLKVAASAKNACSSRSSRQSQCTWVVVPHVARAELLAERSQLVEACADDAMSAASPYRCRLQVAPPTPAL